MSHVPPRPVVESYAAYDVINKTDRNERFRVISETENKAYHEALDKIGFKIVGTRPPAPIGYMLVDADDLDDIAATFSAPNSTEAAKLAMSMVGWELSEPEMMVGGIVGGEGFAGIDN